MQRTKDFHMSNPHILERTPLLVNKHLVQLVKRFEPLNYVPEYGVFAIEVVDVVGQGDEELACATPYRPIC